MIYNITLIILVLVTSNVLGYCSDNPVMECIEPGGTKYFDGLPVTLDCWKQKVTYECHAVSDNNCQELRKQGCSPASASCRSKWGVICAVHDVVYDCPTKKCDKKEVVCGNPKGFCITGDCMKQERAKDVDMNKALAALSAAAEFVNHIDTKDAQNPHVFGGKARECSRNIASDITKDCCGINAKGFLEGKVLKCEPEELEIARAKEGGRAIKIGEYCYNKVLGLCTSYHTTYCLFQSKLARIIQVGAREQLGMKFGDPQNPDCRALTMKEFEAVNFNKIDFSEFHDDIKRQIKTEDSNVMIGRAKHEAGEYQKQADLYKWNVEKMRDKMKGKFRGAQENTLKKTDVAVTNREEKNKNGW